MTVKHQQLNKRPALEIKKHSNRQIDNTQKSNHLHWISIIFIALYLFVDFIPEWGGIDVMGSQWVYLVIINFLTTIYIFSFSKDHGYEQTLRKLFSKFMVRAYAALLVIAGISIVFAINPTEAVVSYTTVIVTIVAFLNIAVLLNGRLLAFKTIAQIASFILLIQGLHTLSIFFKGMETIRLAELIYNIKGNTGNKNIFAASMALKLALVMYCVYTFKSWFRFIHIIALIVGAIALFFVNARSAYLGLFLETGMFITFIILQHFKEKKIKETLFRSIPVVAAVFIAFLIAQITLEYAEKLNINKSEATITSGTNFSSVTARLKSLTVKSNNATRLHLWSGGLDYIKKNPVIGAGIGNCKLAIVPYEKEFIRDFQFAKHLHQDFIQIAMETGVVGGLLFISLFVCALVYTIKVWRSKTDDQVKIIVVFSLIALAGYTIDSLFNFPSERPIMQLLFALILGANIAGSIHAQKEKTISSRNMVFTNIFSLISILFLCGAAYYKYIAYQSLIAQGLSISDFPNKTTHNWREVNDKLPDIPNIDANNIPIDVVRAWYLLDDKRYDEAMVLLNRSTKINPYNMANEFVKGQIFLQTNQLDSAWYYARKCSETRPNNVAIYNFFNNICLRRGDTISIKKAFSRTIKTRNEPIIWNEYIYTLSNLNYDKTKLLAILDSAIKHFPNDRSIQERTYSTKANVAYASNDINTALTYFSKLYQLNPTDNANIENVGICYYVLKKYDLAIPYFDKLIATNVYTNGKPEYFKGICLTKLGKQDQACFFLRIASSKNFPQASSVVASYCK